MSSYKATFNVNMPYSGDWDYLIFSKAFLTFVCLLYSIIPVSVVAPWSMQQMDLYINQYCTVVAS